MKYSELDTTIDYEELREKILTVEGKGMHKHILYAAAMGLLIDCVIAYFLGEFSFFDWLIFIVVCATQAILIITQMPKYYSPALAHASAEDQRLAGVAAEWAANTHPAYSILIFANQFLTKDSFAHASELNEQIDESERLYDLMGLEQNDYLEVMLQNIESTGTTGGTRHWTAEQFLSSLAAISIHSSKGFKLYDRIMRPFLLYAQRNKFPDASLEFLVDHIFEMDGVISRNADLSSKAQKSVSKDAFITLQSFLIDSLTSYMTSKDWDSFKNSDPFDRDVGNYTFRLRLWARNGYANDKLTEHYEYLVLNRPETLSHIEFETIGDRNQEWFERLYRMLGSTTNKELLERFINKPIYNKFLYKLMSMPDTSGYYSQEQYASVIENAWNDYRELNSLLEILGHHPNVQPMRLQITERLATLEHQAYVEEQAQKTREARERQAEYAQQQAEYARQQAQTVKREAEAQTQAAQEHAEHSRRRADEAERVRRRLES